MRITPRAFVILFAALLYGCAGPKVQMAVLHPPSVAEALKMKLIALGEFEGRRDEANLFAHDIESLLASVRIHGKPYFEIVTVRETASLLRNKRLAYRDLDRPDVARSVGLSLRADGIFLGSIVRSGITDSPYQERRSQCIRSKIRYNKKGKPIGEVCIKSENYLVGCIKRDAVFEFQPHLIETATGKSIFSDTLTGSVFDKGCSDSGRPIADGSSLLAQARQDVLVQIRVALAPVEDSVAAEIMEADNSFFGSDGAGAMRSKASESKFASGLEFAKAGRMDRACEIWKALEPIENEYVPLIYNIGLCEESIGNIENARDYFTRADRLSAKPDKKVAIALSRIEKQIQSQQILTQARPDIFYRSIQTRTVQLDQKIYGYTFPADRTQIKIRNATAYPEIARSGDTLKISLDYSVMAPKGTSSINVLETMVLKHDGKVLQTLSERPIDRQPGGVSSEVDFKIPAKMPPGTYIIEQKVQAGGSHDIRSVVFVVGS